MRNNNYELAEPCRAGVVSVGGSPEPVVKTLLVHKPALVSFLVSQQTVEKISEIKAACRNEGLTFEDRKFMANNAEDLVDCYKQARQCVEWLDANGVSGPDIVVDYTGGTKAMSTALGMATIREGCRFSYVGGKERTEDGMGKVKAGHERIVLSQSPWEIFAVEEKRRTALYFNSYQFDAATTELSRLSKTASASSQPTFRLLERAARGYAAWERFSHAEAMTDLGPCAKGLPAMVATARDKSLDDFCDQLGANVRFLEGLAKKSQAFKELTLGLALDLLANARRRIHEGRFDDAVGRSYRALEMIGQVRFKERFGCSTSDCPPEVLPESIRDEYRTQYASEGKDTLQFGLKATWKALAQAGDELAARLVEKKDQIKAVLHARNHSILAHGAQPIKKGAAQRLLEIVRSLLPQKWQEPTFPRLPWA